MIAPVTNKNGGISPSAVHSALVFHPAKFPKCSQDAQRTILSPKL
jgi:hypothetical protein